MKEHATELFVIAMCFWFSGQEQEAYDVIALANMIVAQGQVVVA